MNGRLLSVRSSLFLVVALGVGLAGLMASPRPLQAVALTTQVEGGDAGGIQSLQIGDDDQPTANSRRDRYVAPNTTARADGEPVQPSDPAIQAPERSAAPCLLERVRMFVQLCLVLKI